MDFLPRKGFYIALATCLVAVGAATWTAVNTFSSLDKDVTLNVPSDVNSQQEASSVFSRPSSLHSVVSGEDESVLRPYLRRKVMVIHQKPQSR